MSKELARFQVWKENDSDELHIVTNINKHGKQIHYKNAHQKRMKMSKDVFMRTHELVRGKNHEQEIEER